MKWTSAKESIPTLNDPDLMMSRKVLCEDVDGEVCIASVLYEVDDALPPTWIESGRDMYAIDGIVKWVYLDEVVANIELQCR